VGTRCLVVKRPLKFPRVFQWGSISPATFEHKTHTGPRYFSEKSMSNFLLLVFNYRLLGGGLHGRIEPARKVRSPLGVSGNQGFYRTSTHLQRLTYRYHTAGINLRHTPDCTLYAVPRAGFLLHVFCCMLVDIFCTNTSECGCNRTLLCICVDVCRIPCTLARVIYYINYNNIYKLYRFFCFCFCFETWNLNLAPHATR
jgi:hypothetical protein